jgi:D-alanyl-D-alanine carboxypeptidase
MRIREGKGASVRLGTFITVLTLLIAGVRPALASYASIVVDARDGSILESVNADTPNYPASLTKMMTLYLAFGALESGALKLDQTLPVSQHAASRAPSRLGLKRGQRLSVRDAIMGLITKSANDAAVVIAEALAGNEVDFARVMTDKAQELGMTQTAFRNASGLPHRAQLTTARDMATLGRALIAHYPQYYSYFATVNYRYNGRFLRNHNRLLTAYEGTDGIKTGYIHAVGYNLVASAIRGDRRLIGVVLGGKTGRQRDRQMAEQFDRSFGSMNAPLVAGVPLPPPSKPTTFASAAPPAPAAVVPPLNNAPTIVAVPVVKTPAPQPQAPAVQVVPPANAAVAAVPAPQVTTIAVSPNVPVLAPPGIRDPDDGGSPEWSVQVGAFSRYAQAHLAVSRATKALPELQNNPVSIQRDDHSRNNLYRARIVGLTETEARQSCRNLKRKKLDCLALPFAGYGEERGEGSE